MRRHFRLNILVVLPVIICCSIAVFTGCRKNTNENTLLSPPDLTTKVSSSVSGFVTDENDLPVKNASVQFGTATISTDKYGYFEAKNIEVVKDAATVTVTKTGYFKNVKTHIAVTGKSAFFRIKLIPKKIAGIINGNTGGTVALTNGLSITLSARSTITVSTGNFYTGMITVSAAWIDPTSKDLSNIMPGDLRGVNTEGYTQLLTSYGMAAVELTGSNGELLQISTGKKATLSLPVPTALSSTAPASIPLWYLEEATGLWKQDGSATKTGSNYIGDVSHFSFWNYDVPSNFVQFNCTVISSTGQPIQNTRVKISSVANPFNATAGYTNALGYVSGLVPDNSQLLLEVFGSLCSGPSYSQTFTTTNTPVSLGSVTINNSSTAIISGTVTNCNNSPVTNGYVIVLEPNQCTKYDINSAGAFNFSKVLCGNAAAVILVGEDASTLQQSNSLNITLAAGVNNVGDIKACGISAAEFFYYNEDGISHLLTMPQDSISLGGTIGTPEGWIWAYERVISNTHIMLNFDNHNPTLNSYQYISNYYSGTIVNARPLSPGTTTLHITEFGPVGQFIAGNFSGVFFETANPNIQHTISASFRTRRK
ncbi:hypothetical protein [Ferruginibacter sp. SUN106]|uniref:carboxypeptidase-like regulatory domain-containing protein n=1 Tax=Ferruginibacter sp. SUN106 TaxID=2978348 RepID=UPI003D36081C